MKNTGSKITAAQQFVGTRGGLMDALAKLHDGIVNEQRDRKDQLFIAISKVNIFISHVVKTQKLSKDEAVSLAQSIQELIEMSAEGLVIKIGNNTAEEVRFFEAIDSYENNIVQFFKKECSEDFKFSKPSLIALLAKFNKQEGKVNEYIKTEETKENALNIEHKAYLQKQTKAKVGNILNAKK